MQKISLVRKDYDFTDENTGKTIQGYSINLVFKFGDSDDKVVTFKPVKEDKKVLVLLYGDQLVEDGDIVVISEDE